MIKRKSRRFGIRARLFLAFGALAIGMVVSGIAASLLLTQVGGMLNNVANRNIPEVVTSLRLEANVGALVAGAPALVRAETELQRSDQWAVLEDRRALVQKDLDGLHALLGNKPAVETIKALVADLGETLGKLHDAVGDRLMIADQRTEAAKSNVRALDRLRGIIGPALETAQSAIAAASVAAQGDPADAAAVLSRLVTTDVPLTQGLAELLSVANQASNLLSRSAIATSTQQIAEARAEFDTIARRTMEQLTIVEQLHPTEGLRAAAEAVLIRGTTKNNLFSLRTRELDATHESRAIMGKTETITAALNERVAAQVEMVKAQTKAATDRSDGVIRAGMTIVLAIAAVGVLGAVLIVSLYIGRSLVRRITGLERVMARLAEGDLTADVPPAAGRDEIDDMTTTVDVFKRNAVAAERLRTEQDMARAAREARTYRLETLVSNFETQLGQLVNEVTAASSELGKTARVMSGIAGETTTQTETVTTAAQEASVNVGTVATAAEELAASISEISRQVVRSSEIANRATAEAARTDTVVRALSDGAQKIGDVVSLINSIASQTNLLALNATIEAARAGEAGKGFAVVASEVKGLAAQTTRATEEIGQQISQIQLATREAAEAIQGIAATIGEVSNTFTSIAAAIEEQGAATDEIARNVQQAAHGTHAVTDTIAGVSRGATETGAAASQVLDASTALSKQADRLSAEVDVFIAGVKAA